MSENGGSHNGGDSDNSQNGDTKVCRDFVRNVCNRGKNCKFIHPENVKIRTEPIFCHDYQQSKCFRSTCKFIHCSREDEDHYKQTGELPEGASGVEYYEPKPVRGGGSGGKGRGGSNVGSGGRKPSRGGGPSGNRGGGRNGFGNGRNGNMNGSHGHGGGGGGDTDIPVCKDNLKGLCDRPPGGCKFRHMNPVESYGGGGGMQNRRRGGNQNYYDAGPEAKRNHYSTDYDDFGSSNDYTPPPPPPPPQSNYSMYHDTGSSHTHSHSHGGGGLAHQNSPQVNASYGCGGGIANRNGYAPQHQTQHQQQMQGSQMNDISSAITSFATPVTSNANTAAAMKALEDENFMLKRRIEELKKQVSDLVATNEYLLSQNAHLRINNMNITKEVQVQGVSATGQTASVVQTLVSMAQPMVINPSLSVAATQPLSTITSLPTVSMTPVSISQSLPVVSMAQHPSQQPQSVYPLVTTQGVLPPPN